MRIEITEVHDGFFGTDVDPTPEESEELTARYERQLRANLGADYPGAEIYIDWVAIGKTDVRIDLENGATPGDVDSFEEEQRIEKTIHEEQERVWASLW